MIVKHFVVFDNHRRSVPKVFLLFSFCSWLFVFNIYSCSGLKINQGDSASLISYQSCYDPYEFGTLQVVSELMLLCVVQD